MHYHPHHYRGSRTRAIRPHNDIHVMVLIRRNSERISHMVTLIKLNGFWTKDFQCKPKHKWNSNENLSESSRHNDDRVTCVAITDCSKIWLAYTSASHHRTGQKEKIALVCEIELRPVNSFSNFFHCPVIWVRKSSFAWFH